MFSFSWIGEYAGLLAKCIFVTLELSVVSAAFGMLLGILLAWVLTWGPRVFRPAVKLYIESIRNTPFMIQLFFLYFGLPQLGVEMEAPTAAYLAMILYVAAYCTEIIRAGLNATPMGQVEAGLSLGMSKNETFFHVLLVPALQRVWPALSSQIVISMLGSAVVSLISVQDLSYATSFIETRNFRSFETYLFSTLAYLLLAVALRRLLALVPVFFFSKGSAP